MNALRKLRMLTLGAILGAGLLHPTSAGANTPITGMPVAELDLFDQLMVDFMEANGINAGLLGIMKDGVIVYQRGFGWKDSNQSVTAGDVSTPGTTSTIGLRSAGKK